MIIKFRCYIRQIVLKLFSYIPMTMPLPSDEEIDVVIPVAHKDFRILPLCLEGVRKNVANRIKSIYIVAASNHSIIQFCKEHDVIFVDENSVLGFGPKDVNLIVKGGVDRSGWLFQQFLKLSGKIGTCENYLCVDSDHILINPHTFLSHRNIPVFYMSSELHQSYYNMIKRISFLNHLSFFSYVSHKMIFNKRELEYLHVEINKKTNLIWYQGILNNYNKNDGAGFSEFEIYGNYIKKKIHIPWKQKQLSYEEIASFEELCRLYRNRYNSLTFPNYLNPISNV